MRFHLSAAVMLCALALVPPDAAAQSGAPLAGLVLSASGAPIAGATVSISTLAGPTGQSAVTSADGRFAFDAVPSGDLQIRIAAVGFSSIVERVRTGDGALTDLVFALPDLVLERVNVIGHAARADRLPGSAQMIEGRDMERAQIASATGDIHQLLRPIPGLNIQEEDGYGLRPNIGMRGTGTDRSSKITMMEDGVLAAPAPYSAPAAYYSPTPGRMEGIEVRKGSSQIKYGPMTTGGVLNYVSTAIPSDFRIRTNLALGGDNLGRVSANVGDSFQNFGWLVETFQFHTDGFKRLDGGGDTGVRLEDYLGKLRFNTTPTESGYQEVEVKLGRTGQIGDETYLGLADADFARAPVRRYAASQVDVFESTHTQYQARHLLARRSWDLTTVAYRNNFSRAWYKLENVMGTGLGAVLANPSAFDAQMNVLLGGDSDVNALVARNNNRSYYGTGVQSVLGLAAGTGGVRHDVEIGVRYHKDEEDRFQQDDAYQMSGGRMLLTRAGAPGSQTNQVVNAVALAGFVSDTMSLGRWVVAPGLRYERIEMERLDYLRTDPERAVAPTIMPTSVTAFIPGVGVTYAAAPGVSLVAGLHKGFAPPGPGLNAATVPEESLNYEFGARTEHGGVNTEVLGFFNDYGNLLGRDTASAGGEGDGDLFNGGKARVYGLEASAGWTPVGAPGGLALPVRVAYTYTKAEFRNAFQSQYGPWGTVRVGDELPYVPAHQLYASLDVERRALRVRLDATYVGAMRTVAGQGARPATAATDDYLVLGLSGEHAIGGSASLYASVQNLGDARYIVSRHPAGVRPGLPRLVTAGIKFGVGR